VTLVEQHLKPAISMSRSTRRPARRVVCEPLWRRPASWRGSRR
jgi:hypothetical protein